MQPFDARQVSREAHRVRVGEALSGHLEAFLATACPDARDRLLALAAAYVAACARGALDPPSLTHHYRDKR